MDRSVRALVLALTLACRREPEEPPPRVDAPRCATAIEIVIEDPRASATDVDAAIASVLFEAAKTLRTVERVEVLSREGVAQARLELAADADPTATTIELQASLQSTRLPADALPPVVHARSSERAPVLLAVTRDDTPPPVEARPIGRRERTIEIAIDPQRMTALAVPLPKIVDAIREAVSEYASIESLPATPLPSTSGQIRLADVAEIVDTQRATSLVLDRNGPLVLLEVDTAAPLERTPGIERVVGPITLPACAGGELRGLATAITLALPGGTDEPMLHRAAEAVIERVAALDDGAIAITDPDGVWAGPTPAAGPRIALLLPTANERDVLTEIAELPGLAVMQSWRARPVALRHSQFEALAAASTDLRSALQAAGFAAHALDGGEEPELRIEPNGEAIDRSTLALYVRASTDGIDVGTLRRVPVRLRLQTDAPEELTIAMPDGRVVPIFAVAKLERRLAPLALRRIDGLPAHVLHTDASPDALAPILAALAGRHAGLQIVAP